MKILKLIFLCIFFAVSSQAQTPSQPQVSGPQSQVGPQPQHESHVQEAPVKAEPQLAAHLKSTVAFQYSYLDLIIPGKYGVSFSHKFSDELHQAYEFDYLRGSIAPFVVDDLGSFSEERLTVQKRIFSSAGSFNYFYGIAWNKFEVHLGDAILSRLSSGAYPSVDLLSLHSLGVTWGVGNRWINSRGYTFGVDWFSISQPLIVTEKQDTFLNYATNTSDREAVRDLLDVVAYFPRITLLKLQLGYSF